MERAELTELLRLGFVFHGHKCPAMPLGLRAGVAAMRALGVERAKDKELHVISETGKGHAGACFLDGVMVATGCTYGKGNVEKLYYNKLAFTLVDVSRQTGVRASIVPHFVEQMLRSPFVKLRRQGVAPQDISDDVVEPLIERILSLPEEEFLRIAPISQAQVVRGAGVFDAAPCDCCGEMVFVDKLKDTAKGRLCLGCAEGGKEGA